MNANVFYDHTKGRLQSLLNMEEGLRNCAYPPCPNTFRRPPSMDGPYCSTECYHAHRFVGSAMCEWCAQAFPQPSPFWTARGDGRFCSRACGSASRRRQVEMFCLWDGKPFSVWASKAAKGNAYYCSIPCRQNYEAQQQLAHFWDTVDQSGGPDACWPWMGGRTKSNYGRFHLCGKTYRAHRIAFILVKGPLADGEDSLHECDAPPCCNPEHLFKGTQIENVKDRDAKGRQARGDRSGARKHPERVARGERNASAKLTEITARECYGLKGTMSQEVAARIFHIDQTVVSDLWNQRSWKHIHPIMGR